MSGIAKFWSRIFGKRVSAGLCIAMGLSFLLGMPEVRAADAWIEEIHGFRSGARESVSMADEGRFDDAALVAFAGFRKFEESRVHQMIAGKNYETYRQLEGNWLMLIRALERQNLSDARTNLSLLEKSFTEAEELLAARTGNDSVLFNSFMILFREGFEALLILGAVVATFRKMGRQNLERWIWGGAGLALVASLGLFGVSRKVLSLQGLAREAIEGFTMLLAAGVLFYLSFWLISKVEARRWQAFIRNKVDRALSRQNIWAIGALSFLVVFREGFETVLLLTALEAGATSVTPIIQGVGLATLALGGVFVAMIVLGLRLPIRVFFSMTSACLLLLVVKFVGDGVLELQEAMIMPIHAVGNLNPAPWLRAFFGIHPSWQGMGAQLGILATIIIGLLITFTRKPVEAVVAGDHAKNTTPEVPLPGLAQNLR